MPCLLLILPVLAPDAAAAVQQQRPDTARVDTVAGLPLYHLEGITVTVTRMRDFLHSVPYAASLVTSAQIQGAEATISLDEALAEVPGVYVNNRYNFALGNRISIRGFGARSQFGVRGIRVMQDGIPLTLPDGQAQLNNLDLANAGRIEVIRGAASSLYGNAGGGVISVESEAPPPTPFRPEVRLLSGGFGDDRYYQKYDVKAGGRSGAWDYQTHVGHFQTDGFRPNSAAEYTLLNNRVRYRPDEVSELTAVVNYVNAPVAQNPSSLPRDLLEIRRDTVRNVVWPPDDCPVENPTPFECHGLGESSKQGQAGVTYRRMIETDHEVSVMGYGVFRELDNPIPGTRILLDRWAGGGRAEYRYRPTIGRLARLGIGVDFDHMADDRTEVSHPDPSETQVSQDERVTSFGVFSHAALDLTDRLQWTLSARYDRVRFEADDRLLADGDDSGSRTLDQVSPTIGLRYTHAPWMNVYANFGRSFQTPTTTELSDPFEGGFSASLEPERATNYELGFKGSALNRMSYSLALYLADVEDQLIASRPQAIDRDVFENAGSSVHRGVEAAVSALLAEGLTFTGAYTLADFEFDEFRVVTSPTDTLDFSDNQVPGIPRNRFHGELNYRHPSGLAGSFEMDALDSYFADNANDTRVDAYEIFHVRLAYTARLRDVTLEPFVGVNNIFDTDYIASVVVNDARGNFFEPAPGRNVYLGLRTSLR